MNRYTVVYVVGSFLTLAWLWIAIYATFKDIFKKDDAHEN